MLKEIINPCLFFLTVEYILSNFPEPNNLAVPAAYGLISIRQPPESFFDIRNEFFFGIGIIKFVFISFIFSIPFNNFTA